jgi:hypothetical protein
MKKQLLIPLCAVPLLGLAAVPLRGSDRLAPHESLMATVQAARHNDVKGLLESVLTDDQVDEMRQEWDRQRAEPLDPAEEMQFQMVMAMLTAPGAEDDLMAMLEPKLEEMRPQVAMMVGMFSGLAGAALEQGGTLDSAEQEQAAEILERIAQHFLENDVTDVESARQAVAIVCKMARGLELTTLREVQELSFDDLLRKGDVVMGGVKGVLAVYGLTVDGWLDSFRAETLSVSGDTALVQVEYEILGVKASEEVEMVFADGRWVRREVVENAPIGS